MNEEGGISFEPLLGYDEAERLFLDALNSDRLHHAWLLTGPKGIGKATFAYRLSALLLSDSTNGDIDELHPAIRLLRNEAHPDLRILKRGIDPKTGKLKSEISVADIRVLQGFLGSTAAQGGWRIIIIDAADDLNRNAANALLKILEEPPKKVAFFLISHAPGRLLPTIRSRCRHLALH
ncbi:MAG: AAA family ATPase, partial [Sphingomonadales bacterium]